MPMNSTHYLKWTNVIDEHKLPNFPKANNLDIPIFIKELE